MEKPKRRRVIRFIDTKVFIRTWMNAASVDEVTRAMKISAESAIYKYRWLKRQGISLREIEGVKTSRYSVAELKDFMAKLDKSGVPPGKPVQSDDKRKEPDAEARSFSELPPDPSLISSDTASILAELEKESAAIDKPRN